GGPGGACIACRRAGMVLRSATGAHPTDSAPRTGVMMIRTGRRSASTMPQISGTRATTSKPSATQRAGPRRDTACQPAVTAISRPSRISSSAPTFRTVPATSTTMAATSRPSAAQAAPRSMIPLRPVMFALPHWLALHLCVASSPGDELAEFPQRQQGDGGHQGPCELAHVDLGRSEQPVERVHLGDKHGERELPEYRPVHLP